MNKKKIALLTSSRADYGIYVPLISTFNNDENIELDIIAFGTHVSTFFGETVKQIENDGFIVKHKINSLIHGEGPDNISDAMGLTMIKFSSIWSSCKYNLCIVLGDRYEMFAAAYSSIPFNVPIAHLFGGEQTLGAIDNKFRDGLTVLADYHFTSTDIYAKRVSEIKGSNNNIYNVGSMSYDNLADIEYFTVEEMMKLFQVDLSKPSILVTFHPETVSFEKNKTYVEELVAAMKKAEDYQFIITMPNADTMGGVIRDCLNEYIKSSSNSFGIESFGMKGYLSCMKHCCFLLGNTSSGFVEASYFPKYVINLGDRQKGRILTPNIRNSIIDQNEILRAIDEYKYFDPKIKVNIYGNGNSAKLIHNIIKTI